MARTHYSATFPNARPGDAVTWPNTVKVYGDGSDQRPMQEAYLDESNSVSLYSDATSLPLTARGETVTLTTGAPSNTGAADTGHFITKAQAATTYQPQSGTTIGVFGDSITALNGATSGDDGFGNRIWPARGYLHQANVLLGHRLRFAVSAGVGGNTTTQMLARITDVTGPKPAFCVVEGGINDIVGGASAATIEANLTAICAALIAAGIRPVLCTLPPSSYIWAVPASQTVQMAVNEWIKDYARTQPMIVLCDWYPVLADPVAGGPLISLYVAEGDGGHVHPNPLGAYRMGRVLADALSRTVPAVDMLVCDSTDPTNLFANGLMGGTVGESNLPTSWGLALDVGGAYTGRTALVARTDNMGNWVEITNPAATSGFQFYQHVSTGWAVGDTIVAQIEFETDDDWTSASEDLYANITFVAGAGLASDVPYQSGNGTHNFYRAPKGVFRTAPMAIPTGTTRVDFQVFFTGPGTVRLGRASLRKQGY